VVPQIGSFVALGDSFTEVLGLPVTEDWREPVPAWPAAAQAIAAAEAITTEAAATGPVTDAAGQRADSARSERVSAIR
jgi:hypothetical protein